jgi:phage-related protein
MSSFKYITADGIFDAADHGISIITTDLPLLPNKRSVSERIIGRNGNVVFEDAYDNKEIALECTFIDGVALEERRQTIREVSAALSKPGSLILSYEPDKKYFASLTKQASLKINNSHDVFSLSVEVEPIAHAVYDPQDLTWEQAEMTWYSANFPWNGYQSQFTIPDASETISVVNLGNFESTPIVILTGVTATTKIALGTDDFTITGLNGTIYVDLQNLIVYSGTTSYVNELSKFSGDFIKLQPGPNSLVVTSTGFTSLTVGFRNQDAWI